MYYKTRSPFYGLLYHVFENQNGGQVFGRVSGIINAELDALHKKGKLPDPVDGYVGEGPLHPNLI